MVFHDIKLIKACSILADLTLEEMARECGSTVFEIELGAQVLVDQQVQVEVRVLTSIQVLFEKIWLSEHQFLLGLCEWLKLDNRLHAWDDAGTILWNRFLSFLVQAPEYVSVCFQRFHLQERWIHILSM